jgi:sarcosine oxidase, subunit alpha
MPRLRPPVDPVTIHFDRQGIEADRGEPVAMALVAAGHLALARSPKFHRPRGPWCLRGACDGCLARVGDVPNVMTCRVPAEEGMRIETQNVVGSAQVDLLQAADWFFPDGMNHHELWAGIPGAERVLQGVARRVAGLGRLPREAKAPRPSRRRDVDVLVVGSGPAGMSAALALERRGRRVEVLEEDLVWGGGSRAFPAPNANPWHDVVAAFDQALRTARVSLRLRTTAAGIYGDDILVASEAGVELLVARTLVLAPGAHDGVLAFEGNDLPGVVSARAAAWMATRNVVLGARVVVALVEGGGPFGEACARAIPGAVVIPGAPLRAHGSSRVRAATVAGVERRLPCDALVVDAPRSPAYELCVQAGAELDHVARGFVVKASNRRIRDGVFAIGEVVGTPFNPSAIAREAAAVAEAEAQRT